VPEPVDGAQRYAPGLDGLRAFAVLAVIAYHLGFGWAGGGLLGVGVFFTLSGYLITDLLLSHYEATGRLGLGRFWLHRARRLLPAMIVLLILVAAWVTVLHRSQLPSLRGAVVAALAYVSNWWLIGQHVSYFTRFGPPSPLGHLWSLAVEEQFYLLWPWLLLLGVFILRGRRSWPAARNRLAACTIVLSCVSAVLMFLLYSPGLDSTRVYDGTDTRAFGLLIGAALAMVWPRRMLRADIELGARRLVDGVAGAALLVVVIMVWRTTEYSPFLYRGGLVLLSVATAVLIAGLVHPASTLARVMGCGPLRWIGVRSYGIYLWHFPIIVLSTAHANAAVDPLRATLQVGATIAVAAVSWRFVENPIRHGALGRLWAQRHLLQRDTLRRWMRSWRSVPAAVAFALLGVACLGMSAAPSTPPSATATSTNVDSARHVRDTRTSSDRPAAAGATSCRSVVHIGDSTSEGMVSPDYLPVPAQRLAAQYARIGIRSIRLRISGGTSILETAQNGQANASDITEQLVARGYHGCWVLALGTNDTADVFVGSAQNRAARIAHMMTLIGDQPVLWITVKSLLASGPYAESNMQQWNSALVNACASHPSMRVFDWASVAKANWFTTDGIHYTTAGYRARAHLIATALADAFAPHARASNQCLVR
jgi:peptidoglycan/LPS O-acetylase OafA/YrhL